MDNKPNRITELRKEANELLKHLLQIEILKSAPL